MVLLALDIGSFQSHCAGNGHRTYCSFWQSSFFKYGRPIRPKSSGELQSTGIVVPQVNGLMNLNYHTGYPGSDDLRERARRRTPRFAFEYLDGGCNEDVNLRKNTDDLRQVELKPCYLTPHETSSLKTELFGHEYDAPFGIAPIGLQGLMWPGAPEILARAAVEHNVPFILSTVSTASIERIGEITGGRFWYQLYHPSDNAIRDDILNRAEAAGCKTLVLLCDTPTVAYRPRDIRNGLAMPPRMTIRNVLQMFGRPNWAMRTLLQGTPHFATMAKYMPKGLSMTQLGAYMSATFSGRLNEAKIAPIRDRWKGNLVLKGVASEEDTERAVRFRPRWDHRFESWRQADGPGRIDDPFLVADRGEVPRQDSDHDRQWVANRAGHRPRPGV